MEAGDTLYFSTDNLPGNTRISGAGPDQYWDYSQLLSPFVRQSIVLPVASSRRTNQIQDAILMVRGVHGKESYYARREGGLYLVAEKKRMPGTSEPNTASYEPGLPYQQNLVFGDDELFIVDEITTIPKSSYAAWMKAPAYDMDSLRLRYAIEVRSNADAWGTLLIPAGMYEVIREQRTEVRRGFLEKKVNGVWLDVSLFCKFPDVLNRTENTQVFFWSDETREPVLALDLDFGRVEVATYKGRTRGAKILQSSISRPDIFVYPNPSFGSVRFDIVNVEPGHYYIEIFNILGVELRSEKISINGDKTLPLDLSHLRKGTYLYRLVDSDQNAIRSKRLVIITP